MMKNDDVTLIPPAAASDGSAPSTERVDPGPASGGHPWLGSLAGAALLAAGAVLVVVFAAVVHSGGNWRSGPPGFAIDGSAFALLQGRGHAEGRAFVLEATDRDRLAVLSARVPKFRADGYPRVDFTLHAEDVLPVQLAFVWRTEERPNRNFSKSLTWTGTRIAPLELGAEDGWSGSITGVALVARGALPRPLVLESLTVPAVSAPGVIADLIRQWSAFIPIVAASVTLPFDDERSHYVTLLETLAFAAIIAALAHWLLTRRAVAPDPRVYWAIALAAWLVLDARWQVNLWRQLVRTEAMYAGKSVEEKRLASDDRELYTLMQEVGRALPAPPVRIHFLADDQALRTRGSYFLYPQNVYYSSASRARKPTPDDLRSGDYVLLLLTSDLAYDRGAQTLVWQDGRRKPAEEILTKPRGLRLVRVR